MSQENVEIIRRVFDAWAAGDWSIGNEYLEEHAVCVVSSDFPAFGAYYGIDGIRAYWRDFVAQWEQLTFEATSLEAVGDTVLAEATQHAKGRASGVEGDLCYFILFTFRGGKIVRMESVMSRDEALEAVGLRE
ncbi:MAG: SnoaL-like domain [Solirubrobacteraceae bacterium]|jgi:ketosteroid isomerase-like protein|nr:SnoaL-like domain [Solirubrobacteraceae bacterium]